MKNETISIIGCGNIGTAIASGMVKSNKYLPSQFILTRRKIDHLNNLKKAGFNVSSDNYSTIEKSDVIILAVEPQKLEPLLEDIGSSFKTGQILISVISGATINDIAKHIESNASIVRAMPNTAIAIQESMTCLASSDSGALITAQDLFDCVGQTLIVDEEQMVPATALGACGIAFFLRAIRSASQGGIEIGFNSESAFKIASQTARGAASLLLESNSHPEAEIDRVTTPRGCTIAGLNEMEHKGFSSAMIKGITTSAEIAAELFKPKN